MNELPLGNYPSHHTHIPIYLRTCTHGNVNILIKTGTAKDMPLKHSVNNTLIILKPYFLKKGQNSVKGKLEYEPTVNDLGKQSFPCTQ